MKQDAATLKREITRLRDEVSGTPVRHVLLQGVDADGEVTGTFTPQGDPVEPTGQDHVFQIVDAMLPALLDPRRYAVVSSGRSAGKSHGAARFILAVALTESCRIMVARETLISLEESMYALLRDLIQADGYLASVFNVERARITCTATGTEIIFKGLRRDRVESSIKSIERIKYAVVEESQTISRVSLRILRPSIRDDESRIIFMLNPRYVDDSVHEEFVQRDRDDCAAVHFTYRDNFWCPQVMLEEAERDYQHNPAAAQHIWGGELARTTDELVFSNWIVDPFDIAEIQRELRAAVTVKSWRSAAERRQSQSVQLSRIDAAFRVGLDHGWVNPSAAVELYVDQKHKRVFVSRELYQTRLPLDEIARRITAAIPRTGEKWPVEVDNARPDVIDFLRKGGVNAHPGKKVPVAERIDTLQTWLIVVHPDCTNMIRELSSYRWKKDRNDRLLPEPEKENDHLLDAMSYALAAELRANPIVGYKQLADPWR